MKHVLIVNNNMHIGGVQKALRLRNPRVITWAFIAWDK